jgi:hypothetical protein
LFFGISLEFLSLIKDMILKFRGLSIEYPNRLDSILHELNGSIEQAHQVPSEVAF